ncbi:MAG: hypothetical protein K2P60_11285, partial [Lachnospiraceae bacterium]|nr:hypothetical protein [Lachnospiraceae bacterium]
KNKFVKKVFTLALTVIAISTVSSEPALACKITDNTCIVKESSNFSALDTVKSYQFVKKGEKFLNTNGNVEQVIRVNKDGSFFTEEINVNTYAIKNRKAACSHPSASLVAIVNLLDDTEKVKTASCCFKYRSVTKYRCKKCGNSSIIQYGAWQKHKKHSYPLFGKKCKTCGFKK